MTNQVVKQFIFKNEKHWQEFLGQLTDGFGENYVSIEQAEGRGSENAFVIEMFDNEFFQDGGWHLEQQVTSGLWLETDQVYEDRGEAIMASLFLEKKFSNRFRVKEDYES